MDGRGDGGGDADGGGVVNCHVRRRAHQAQALWVAAETGAPLCGNHAARLVLLGGAVLPIEAVYDESHLSDLIERVALTDASRRPPRLRDHGNDTRFGQAESRGAA